MNLILAEEQFGLFYCVFLKHINLLLLNLKFKNIFSKINSDLQYQGTNSYLLFCV